MCAQTLITKAVHIHTQYFKIILFDLLKKLTTRSNLKMPTEVLRCESSQAIAIVADGCVKLLEENSFPGLGQGLSSSSGCLPA